MGSVKLIRRANSGEDVGCRETYRNTILNATEGVRLPIQRCVFSSEQIAHCRLRVKYVVRCIALAIRMLHNSRS
jgi:hypothetical protein